MKKSSKSEKLILEDITDAAYQVKSASKGLSVGEMIALIRNQLGMSQKVLAKLAKVPQSTISRVEGSKREPNLSTLKKILKALSCDILIVPLLVKPIEVQLRNQARCVAESHARYLQGTMSLEKQEPDKRFLEELIKEEEQALLHAHRNKLWKQ